MPFILGDEEDVGSPVVFEGTIAFVTWHASDVQDRVEFATRLKAKMPRMTSIFFKREDIVENGRRVLVYRGVVRFRWIVQSRDAIDLFGIDDGSEVRVRGPPLGEGYYSARGFLRMLSDETGDDFFTSAHGALYPVFLHGRGTIDPERVFFYSGPVWELLSLT
jgi:hypothetical protein